MHASSVSMMFCTVVSSILTIMLLSMVITSLFRNGSNDNSNNKPSITRVAFIGNSFQFVNDLPRFIETLVTLHSDGAGAPVFVQDSVLHGSLSLTSILKKGNGMYQRWNTTNAIISDYSTNGVKQQHQQEEKDRNSYNYNYYSNYYNKDDNEASLLYDYGLCTVAQLLSQGGGGGDDGGGGYAPNLVEDNENGYYSDKDGLNPCFQDSNYLSYTQYKYSSNQNSYTWDYVVLNDQSTRPANINKRTRTMKALKNKYAPLLVQQESNSNPTLTSVPILFMTYGYHNRTDGLDLRFALNITRTTAEEEEEDDIDNLVPIFTSKLYRGYQLYAQTLDDALYGLLMDDGESDGSTSSRTSKSITRIAPVGLIYLLIYEENYNFWKRLFFVKDNYHPSPLGTYIIGCTIYCTIYNKLPLILSSDVSDESYINRLFSNARAMSLDGDSINDHDENNDHELSPLPTIDDILYVRYMIKRVMFMNQLPKSLIIYQNDSDEEDSSYN